LENKTPRPGQFNLGEKYEESKRREQNVKEKGRKRTNKEEMGVKRVIKNTTRGTKNCKQGTGT
jgi:hypothetical protein